MYKTRLRKFQIILLPSIVLISFALIFLQFLFTLKYDISKSTYADLENTAEQQIETISVKLNGQYEVLNGISKHITNEYDLSDLTQISGMLKDFAQSSGFVFLAIASTNGTAQTTQDSLIDVSDREYFQSSLDGNFAIEKVVSDPITTERAVILSVPVYSEDNLSVIGVVMGGMKETDFFALLYSSAYDENTYSFVADSNGTIIIPSDSPNFLHTSDNIFDLYIESENSLSLLDDFLVKLKLLKSDAIDLKIKDSERYVLYTNFGENIENLPIGAQDWFLFTSVPAEAVDVQNSHIPQTVSVLTLELLLVAAFCFAYVFYLEYKKNKATEQETNALRESEQMYRVINDFSDNIIFVYDYSTRKLMFNNKYEKIFKHKPFVDSLDKSTGGNPYINKYDYSAYAKFVQEISQGLPKASAEFRILRPDGLYDWYKADFTALYDNVGNPTKTIGRLANVQEHHTKIEELTLRAETDSLTKIYNHISMKEKINRYLAEGGKGSTHAFLYIDIDNFKTVNDNFGHITGDDLLVNIASKMREIFRETDFVGRLGGDEFAVFIKDMHYEAMIHKKTQNLLDAICQMKIESGVINLSCSIGISIYSKHGNTFEKLYRNADKALYKAKTIKNTYVIYSPADTEMQKGAHEPSPIIPNGLDK